MNTLKIFKTKGGLKIAFFILASSLWAENLNSINVDSLLNQLSPRELAGQMIMVYHSPPEFLEKHSMGNVLVMQNMLKDPQKLKRELQQISKWRIPPFVAIDQEGGRVNRMKHLKLMPKAPSAKIMSNLDSLDVFNLSYQIATLMKEIGINLNLAPVLDPEKNYLSQNTFMFLQDRSFGDTPQSTANISAYIRGMSKAQVGCISKHFPGYDAQSNSDHEVALSGVDSAELEKYIYKFSKFDTLTLGTMMTSIQYDKISNQSAVFDSKIVSLSRRALSDRLIITDDLWGVALRPSILKNYEHGKSKFTDKDFLKITDASIAAGNDILMITFPAKAILMLNHIEKRMLKDSQFTKRIKDSARRILIAKHKLGLI